MSPYLCFISLLYLDLYVLGDDALISQGSFVQTKYLCVLIHIWIKGEVCVPWNRFKPSSKIFYWPFQAGTSFVDLLCFFLSCVCYASVYMCHVVTCWERADLFALFVVSNCEFVTFSLVSWARCGIWLYRFLIIAPLLTLFILYEMNACALWSIQRIIGWGCSYCMKWMPACA